jgi:hypothetical protein
MDAVKLRAWWSHRQGLDGRLLGKPPARVLEETGWARSVGGSSPYLGLFARCGAGREAVDEAVAKLEIHELPSARGCTYVVPNSAFALALKLSQGFGPEADMKVARKLGVTDSEVEKLSNAVLDALKHGPLDPDELKAAIGKAVRNLGEEGKKKGMTTTLPLALGRLQCDGKIRRVPMNGRLDQQRYRYALWHPNPLSEFKLSPDEANVQLARLYFNWIGPATAAEFQAFAAIGTKAAKAALEPLKLKAIKNGHERFILPEQYDEFAEFKVPKQAQYVLTSSLDGILLLRRNVNTLLAPEDYGKSVVGEKGYAEAGGLLDLPNHAILDRGRLVGVWEYDPEGRSSVAWASYIHPNADLQAAVQKMEEYVRSDLGDVRAFSLDSVKSRKPRIEALRKLNC